MGPKIVLFHSTMCITKTGMEYSWGKFPLSRISEVSLPDKLAELVEFYGGEGEKGLWYVLDE